MLPSISTKELEILKTDGVFTIARVPEAALSGVWGFVRDQLESDPSLWNKGQTIQSLRFQIETNQLHLWLVVKDGLIYMTFLTMFKEYPVANSLQVVWGAGGELEKYIAIALEGLKVFAQREGCTDIEIIGREGWEKPLKPFGYTKLSTTFVLHINSERLQ